MGNQGLVNFVYEGRGVEELSPLPRFVAHLDCQLI